MLNEFKQEVLDRVLEVSEGVRTTMVELTGVSNFSNLQGDMLDEYQYTALSLLENELVAMGIGFVETINPMASYAHMGAMCSLRELFDKHTLLEKFNTTRVFVETTEYAMDAATENIDTLLSELIKAYAELVPLSQSWGDLSNLRFDMVSTSMFVSHISAILGEVGVIDSHAKNMFISAVARHVLQAEHVMLHITESGMPQSMKNHDLDLVDVPADIVMDYAQPGNHLLRRVDDRPDHMFIARHKITMTHHIEFYGHHHIYDPTDNSLRLMVAEYCWGTGTADEVVAYTEPLMRAAKINSKSIASFNHMVRQYYQQDG